MTVYVFRNGTEIPDPPGSHPKDSPEFFRDDALRRRAKHERDCIVCLRFATGYTKTAPCQVARSIERQLDIAHSAIGRKSA